MAIQGGTGAQTVIYDWRPDQSNPVPYTGTTYTPSLVTQDFAATCGSSYTVSLQGRDTRRRPASSTSGSRGSSRARARALTPMTRARPALPVVLAAAFAAAGAARGAEPAPAARTPLIFASPIHAGCKTFNARTCQIVVEPLAINIAAGRA